MGNDELDNSQNMLAEGFINRTEAMEAAEKKQEVSCAGVLENLVHDGDSKIILLLHGKS